MTTQLEIDFPDHVIEFARTLYQAYIGNSDGKNYQGLPCPTWENLTSAIRGHWCVVANTALIASALPTAPIGVAEFVHLLNGLAAAWRAIPEAGQVPIGVGSWLQPLINAVTEVVAPDHKVANTTNHDPGDAQ